VHLVGFYYKNTITNITENSECNEVRIIKILNRILQNTTRQQQKKIRKTEKNGPPFHIVEITLEANVTFSKIR